MGLHLLVMFAGLLSCFVLFSLVLGPCLCEVLFPREPDLVEFLKVVLMFLLPLLLLCLLSLGVFLFIEQLLDSGFFLHFKLTVSDLLVALDSNCLFVTNFAALVQLPVCIFGGYHLIFGSRLHVQIEVWPKPDQISPHYALLQTSLLVVENMSANTRVSLCNRECAGVQRLIPLLLHWAKQILFRLVKVRGYLEAAHARFRLGCRHVARLLVPRAWGRHGADTERCVLIECF